MAEDQVRRLDGRIAHANATFKVRVNVGRRPEYFAHIYILGELFATACRRKGGPYQAFAKNQQFLGEVETLSRLRELVVEHYAASTEGQLSSAST